MTRHDFSGGGVVIEEVSEGFDRGMPFFLLADGYGYREASRGTARSGFGVLKNGSSWIYATADAFINRGPQRGGTTGEGDVEE